MDVDLLGEKLKWPYLRDRLKRASRVDPSLWVNNTDLPDLCAPECGAWNFREHPIRTGVLLSCCDARPACGTVALADFDLRGLEAVSVGRTAHAHRRLPALLDDFEPAKTLRIAPASSKDDSVRVMAWLSHAD
jgi:hypothetical protein